MLARVMASFLRTSRWASRLKNCASDGRRGDTRTCTPNWRNGRSSNAGADRISQERVAWERAHQLKMRGAKQ